MNTTEGSLECATATESSETEEAEEADLAAAAAVTGIAHSNVDLPRETHAPRRLDVARLIAGSIAMYLLDTVVDMSRLDVLGGHRHTADQDQGQDQDPDLGPRLEDRDVAIRQGTGRDHQRAEGLLGTVTIEMTKRPLVRMPVKDIAHHHAEDDVDHRAPPMAARLQTYEDAVRLHPRLDRPPAAANVTTARAHTPRLQSDAAGLAQKT